VRAVIAMLLVAGCGRVGFDASDIIASDGGPDAANPNDLDGDGVDNAVDNCPTTANPDQDNEDGDRFGDACDPCPPYADAMPVVDTDLDGVSDACDPNPTIPTETITRFEGFAHAPTTGLRDGNWTFSGGAAHVTSTLNELSGLTWTSTTTSETVSTRVTIDQLYGAGVARPVGVVHQLHEPTDDGLMCVFGINPSNAPVVAIADNATTAALTSTMLPGGSVSVGSMSTLTSTRTTNAYRCISDLAALALTASSPLRSVPNQVGLFTRSAAASFAWVLIVTTTP
jgi:hypothetical protein